VKEILVNWKAFKEKYFRYCNGVLDARFFIEEVLSHGDDTIGERIFEPNRRVALLDQLTGICTKDVVTMNGLCVTKEIIENLLNSRIS
jgi:hypothetical protein